ncbi:GNAT family N-acetyltransferase [Niabella beijingensis]|uniref:GNAT family N-acetyltransferase n=1 Tax=Niabella beijingensis TaxID=2872700 RepID=UPI001CBB9E1D|nr:GNAT family protein [Niabella beijingensis]MBZ4189703.1 GNAT family N-acetyltransferase [Niabella beijingensis]
MIRLRPFIQADFGTFISWMDSAETVMQIAGSWLRFPVTPAQLEASAADPNRHSFAVTDAQTNILIGHCELYQQEHSVKIGKVVIGNRAYRGRGLCTPLMEQLLQVAFEQFRAPLVELNVFDWNTSAIRCYERCGFEINPGAETLKEVNGKTWRTYNMILSRDKWRSTI